jgi:branched-chain amino acid transport system permease protein
MSALRAVWTPLVLLVGLAVMVGLCTAFGGAELQISMTELMIRLSVVIGIYIFVGNSGVLSFGHIGFMCVGAYAAAWATCDPQWKQMMLTGLPDFLQQHRYPMLLAVLGGGVLAAIVALLFGLAIMRLNGIAASIATFAFLVVVNSIYANWDNVTAGTSSLVNIPTVVGPWGGLAFAAVAMVIAYGFQMSGFGLMLRASRDDEVAARSSAIEIGRVRLIAFVISGFVVGAAGGVYAHFLGVLTTDMFYLDLTFITIAMLIVGGVGSLSGAVVGVVFITIVTEAFRAGEAGFSIGGVSLSLPRGAQEIGLGVLMALALIFRPDGVMGGREIPFPFRQRDRTEPDTRAAPEPRH